MNQNQILIILNKNHKLNNITKIKYLQLIMIMMIDKIFNIKYIFIYTNKNKLLNEYCRKILKRSIIKKKIIGIETYWWICIIKRNI